MRRTSLWSLSLRIVAVVVMALGMTNLHAQPVALADPFRVDAEPSSGSVAQPSVSRSADGRFVVTWSVAPQGGNSQIRARRYAANGTPDGVEFAVSSSVAPNNDFSPSVGMDGSGGFFIVWLRSNSAIYGRRFAASGAALGAEFAIDTAQPIPVVLANFFGNTVQRPKIAVNAAGMAVVTWIAAHRFDGNLTPGFSNSVVTVRAYDAAGGPRGAKQSVVGGQYPFAPAVAIDGAGNFVVAWEGRPSLAVSSANLYVRRYLAGPLVPVAAGATFLVSQNPVQYTGSAAIAMNPTGEFVIAWYNSGGATNISTIDIAARRYSALGVARGNAFIVNSDDATFHFDPAVAVDASGAFVIAWWGLQAGVPQTRQQIGGQAFAPDGSRSGTEFRVDTNLDDIGSVPAISVDGFSNTVVVWQSNRFSPSNFDYGRGQPSSIVGRLYSGY